MSNDASNLTWEDIDDMSVESLLRLIRFTPPGDPPFDGRPEGAHIINRCAELRERDPAAYVAASKRVGW